MPAPRPKIPAPQPKTSSPWKRAVKWFGGAVLTFLSTVAVMIAFLQGRPWISIEEGYTLDPANPSSALFTIKNTGYYPIVHLDAVCNVNTSPWLSGAGGGGFPIFVDYMGHEDPKTVPCFKFISADGGPGLIQYPKGFNAFKNGATLNITITYGFFGLNFERLRQSQTFHLVTAPGADGNQHWTFR